MKYFINIICLLFLVQASAQYSSKVNVIEAKPNSITTAQGDLSNGQVISDLSWAANSAVACFPATQNSKFTGNHVFHAFQIPKYSEVTITLTPSDKNANMSLYGYQVGTNNYTEIPDITSCVACEADHIWDRPKVGQTQDHTRKIFFNSTTNAYNIFIGVAGADKLMVGDYILTIDLKTKIEDTEAQSPLTTYSIKVESGKTLTYDGDLAKGCLVRDLSWAANSSVACFPATQNSKFNGNHVFFITEIPKYSDMTITLIPTNKDDNMSVYAYMVGTTNTVMVPELSSCVTCEAEHKWDYPKKGKTQDHTRSIYLNALNNPYRVVIGVAGAEKLTSGTFKLSVTVTPKK